MKIFPRPMIGKVGWLPSAATAQSSSRSGPNMPAEYMGDSDIECSMKAQRLSLIGYSSRLSQTTIAGHFMPGQRKSPGLCPLLQLGFGTQELSMSHWTFQNIAGCNGDKNGSRIQMTCLSLWKGSRMSESWPSSRRQSTSTSRSWMRPSSPSRTTLP